MPLIPNPEILGGAFPNGTLDVVVEAAFGANIETPESWVWTDLSTRLVSKQITATRGSSDGASTSGAESASLVLTNEDYALTPNHPMGAYYPNITRTVPVRVLLHPGHGDVVDTFTRASTQTNWLGVTESGHEWNGFLFGSNVTWGIDAGVGYHTLGTAGTFRVHYVGLAENAEVRVTCSLNKLAAGGAIEPTIVLRNVGAAMNSSLGYYMARFEVSPTDQKITIKVICLSMANIETVIASTVTSVTHAVATPLQFRARIVGPHIQAKVWQGATEPVTWQMSTFDTTLTGPGAFGIRTGLNGSATNTPVTASYDNYSAVALYSAVAGYAANWQPTYLPEKQGKSWSQVTLTVSGVRRRLARRDSPAWSPIRRTSAYYATRGDLTAYWPLEDGTDSQTASNAVNDRYPMRVQGTTPGFGSYNPAPPNTNTRRWGTAPIASFAEGGRLIGQVVGGNSSPIGWAVHILAAVHAVGAGSTMRILSMELVGGSWVRWELWANFAGGYSVYGVDAAGTSTELVWFVETYTGLLQMQVDAVQSGADVLIRLWVGKTWFPFFYSATLAGTTLGRIRQVVVNPYQQTTAAATTDDGRTFAVGHVQVWDTRDSPNAADSMTDAWTGLQVRVWEAWAGESAEGRMERLCAAEQVPLLVESANELSLTTRLGAQDDAELLKLIGDAADADGGLLYERNFCLAYLARSARYNRGPAIVVDLATYRVSSGGRDNVLVPVFDDQAMLNDLELSRPGGSNARYSDEVHVAANGRYDDSDAVNVHTDAQLLNHASWRVRLGTEPAMRHPQVKVDLAANPELVEQWMSADIGSKIRRSNPPPEYPPGDIDQIIEGYSETFGPRMWQVTANCSPAEPWTVGVVDDDELGRADTDGSYLSSGVTATVTSLPVTTYDGPRWVTDPAQMPFDINVGGERMTVTAVSGTGLSQTFTVVRSVNGVVKTHASFEDVRLWQPMVLAL